MKSRRVRRITFAVVVVAAFLFFVMFVVINTLNAISEPAMRLSVVERGYIEDSISLSGYIFRTQELIDSPVGGVLETVVPAGERVSVGERVAVVYVGNVPAEVMNELRFLNDRIARLSGMPVGTDLFVRDPIVLERQIAAATSAVIDAAYLRDGERLARARQQLDDLITQRNIAIGDVAQEVETVSQLEAQRSALETRHGIRRTDLIATRAGVFVPNVDGLEEYLRIDAISDLTPADMDELDSIPLVFNHEIVPGRPAAKIVDNYRWYFVSVVDTVLLENMQVRNFANQTEANRRASTVWLRFFDVADTRIEGTITFISTDFEGRSVIAVAASGYVDSIYATSRVSVDLVRRSYSGLKVERAAIRVVDGRTGVFVARNNQARFREVQQVHSDEEWSIIYECDDYFNIYHDRVLRMFDEVVITRRELTHNMIIR